jgi:hypothetical protein
MYAAESWYIASSERAKEDFRQRDTLRDWVSSKFKWHGGQIAMVSEISNLLIKSPEFGIP